MEAVKQPEENKIKFKYKLGALAVSSMEAHFLREWVEYHRMLGVQHFYIHDSMLDNADEALKPYIDQGIVDLYHEPRHPCQWEVYSEHFFGPKGIQCEWLCVMDIDEFFVPKTFDHLPTWLDRFEKNVAGVGIAWTCFGSNGHVERPNGTVIENYTKTVDYSEGHHRWIKSIVKPYYLCAPVVDPHYFHPAYLKQFVNPNGKPIHTSEFESTYPTDEIQLNHYVHKSRQDWERKFNRGSPDKFQLEPNRQRKLESFDINEPNSNKVEDKSAWRFLRDLQTRLDIINFQFPFTVKQADSFELKRVKARKKI